MRQFCIAAALICTLVESVGCVSKAYVRNQVTPIIDKVNQLDDATAENTKEIKAVDARIDQAIVDLDRTTDESIAKANDADQQSAAAQRRSDEALQRTNSIVTQVASLDNYKLVTQVSVSFALNASRLDDAAVKALDNFGADAANRKNYVITVEGATDSTGAQDSNYDLSDRRADAVRVYLATRYVPGFRIHVVGLGSDKPSATNKDAAGRAQNRRADVQLFAIENKLVAAPGGEADSTDTDESDDASIHVPRR